MPEHTHVHTGPIHSVAVCTKLFRKLPINTERGRNHSRHQSTSMDNGVHFSIHFGETNNDHLTGFPLHIWCAACSLWFKREGRIANTAAHFLVWARLMRAWARLFAHLPAGCAWARMNRAETTFSSGCPSIKQLSGLWGQACEGLCPGPSA